MITIDNVQTARKRISEAAYHTPLYRYTNHFCNRHLYLKLENLQHIGSFKIRGAYNNIVSLSDNERTQGVIAFSSGNHAQGVAYAAKIIGVKATIVMPITAPQIKIQQTKALGATVVLSEGFVEKDWRTIAEDLANKHGYTMIHPFDDEKVIAGQGTIGLEIVEDLPDVELVLVPIGGGGLLSGIAATLKLINPAVKVVGVEPELAADARDSFHCGKIIEYSSTSTRKTIADGMRATRIGDITFSYIQKYVDDIISVTEDEICRATKKLISDAHIIAEPSGAVSFAAYLFHQTEIPCVKNAVAIISGGNMDLNLLKTLFK